MTRPDLDAISARVEAATEAPWTAFTARAIAEVQRLDGERPAIVKWAGFDDCGRTEAEHHANAEFIAHARTDVPALLAYIEELEAEQKRLRKALGTANAVASMLRSSDGY